MLQSKLPYFLMGETGEIINCFFFLCAYVRVGVHVWSCVCFGDWAVYQTEITAPLVTRKGHFVSRCAASESKEPGTHPSKVTVMSI